MVPFLLLCALAIAGGLGWSVWEHRQATGKTAREIVDGLRGGETASTTPAPPVKAPQPPPDPVPVGGTVRPPDPPPVTGATNPPVRPATETDPVLAGVIRAGEDLMAAGEFGAAKRKFLQALSGRLAPSEKVRVEKLKGNADLYESLVAQVNPADILPIEGRVIVYLRNSGVIDGVLVKESNDGIEVRKRNGILAHFSVVQVERVERQSKDAVLAELDAEYQKRLKSVAEKPRGVDYYELAVFCIQNQLNDRVPDLLAKAVSLDRALLEGVAESKAKVLYNLMVFYQGKGNADAAELKKRELISKFPQSRYAKMASGSGLTARSDPPTKPPPDATPPVRPPPDAVPPEDPPPDPGTGTPPAADGVQPKFANPKVASLVEDGNKWYDVGMTHLEKSFDDKTKDPDGENMKALDAFRKSCDAYQAASDLDPENTWIHTRLNQAQQNRVMCFLAAKTRR